MYPQRAPLYDLHYRDRGLPSPESNQTLPHQLPLEWLPAPSNFSTQEVVNPSTNIHEYFPETQFHTAQEDGRWSLGHKNLAMVQDNNLDDTFSLSQSEAAFGQVGDCGTSPHTLNTSMGHDQALSVLGTPAQVAIMQQDESRSARTTTTVCQLPWTNTKSRKVYGPKTCPILLTPYNTTPIRKQAHGPSGKLQGAFHVFGTKRTQRSKSTQPAKDKLARKSKPLACPRCFKIKKACVWPESLYQPCISCMKADPSIHTMPCIRILIPEIALFRLGPPVDNPNHPLNFFKHRKDLWTIINGVEGVESRILELTQEMGYTLEVKVSPFVPLPGDKTAYEWDSAEGPKRMEMPKYHISDIEEAKKQMIGYVRRSHLGYINNLLDSSNEILMETFNMAVRCKKPMVEQALILWSATRLTEQTWRVCGKDTLGFEPPSEKSNPWKGIIPVNPIMDQQLDQIVIRHMLTPLRDYVLTELHSRLESREKAKKHWFEIYLTIFVLLNNAETQLSMERQFAQRYGMSGRFGPYNKYKDAEDQFHAARTMLSYYHYVCQGPLPLSISTENLMGELEPDQADYVIQLKGKLSQKEKILRRLYLEHQYERDLYWCHQMFFDNWQPGPGHIEELPPDTPSDRQGPSPVQIGT